jgi:hypothetical protein
MIITDVTGYSSSNTIEDVLLAIDLYKTLEQQIRNNKERKCFKNHYNFILYFL